MFESIGLQNSQPLYSDALIDVVCSSESTRQEVITHDTVGTPASEGSNHSINTGSSSNTDLTLLNKALMEPLPTASSPRTLPKSHGVKFLDFIKQLHRE